jgi:hypothetical protein
MGLRRVFESKVDVYYTRLPDDAARESVLAIVDG